MSDDFNITIDGSDEYHQQVSIADRNKSWMEAMINGRQYVEVEVIE